MPPILVAFVMRWPLLSRELIGTLAACVILGIPTVWFLLRKHREKKLMVEVGALSTAALVAGLVTWLQTSSEAAAPAPVSNAAVGESASTVSPPVGTPTFAAPPPLPDEKGDDPGLASLPPVTVELRGPWNAQERIVFQSALAAALGRVREARGARLELDGIGRALAPTSSRVPRYAISGTWTLRDSGGETLRAGALSEIVGWGADDGQARQDAVRRAATAVAANVAEHAAP